MKIQSRKLALNLFSYSIPSYRRIFGAIKTSYVYSFPLMHYFASPFFSSWNFVDSNIFTMATLPLINCILLMGANSEIDSAVIESVSVCMVYFLILWAIHYLPMHSKFAFWNPADCIKTFCRTVPMGIPIPLGQKFKVSNVNYRVLISSKWDNPVRFSLRLGNRVALNLVACFGHVPTSNRNLLLNRIVAGGLA